MSEYVNYDDERFLEVEAEKQAALEQVDATYDAMTQDIRRVYDEQAQAAQDWEQSQTRLQNEKTDQVVTELRQQQEAAAEDHRKEASAAYTDWQKQSDAHGVEAEKLAGGGLAGSGYSESTLAGFYNTYQNRVATARAAYEAAVVSYDNAIAQARLQNSAQLAQIAFDALQTQLTLSLQSLQYQNELLREQAAMRQQVEQQYYDRSQDVLAQINKEYALAEEIRRYNESLAEEIRQFDVLHQKKVQYVSVPVTEKVVETKQVGDVLSLGYGPVNQTTLDRLVNTNQVTATPVGNTTVYTKNQIPAPNNGYTGLIPKK